MNIKYFTAEGLAELKERLHDMKTRQRPAISKQIAEARDKGDLSENAEYDAAKEAQGMLEMKISLLESDLSTARILDTSKLDNSKVMILSKVKIKNLKFNKTMDYMIVTEAEANLKKGKISVQSPIGKSLMGKKVGEIVEVKVPAGSIQLQVLEISR